MTTFITHTAPPDRASVRHHVSARHIATPRKQLNRSVALRRFFAVLTSRKIRFSTRVRGGVTKLRRSCDPMQPVCVHREPRGRRRTELHARSAHSRLDRIGYRNACADSPARGRPTRLPTGTSFEPHHFMLPPVTPLKKPDHHGGLLALSVMVTMIVVLW